MRRTIVESKLCKFAFTLSSFACRGPSKRAGARDVSGSVARESDRVSTRKPPRPHRVSNYRDTAMRNISRMSVRQDGIDKAFVVTSGSSHRPGDISSPAVYISPGSLAHRRLIDATRFLRVITVALERRTGLICRSNLSVGVIESLQDFRRPAGSLGISAIEKCNVRSEVYPFSFSRK